MNYSPAYLALLQSGELQKRVEQAKEMLAACNLCPHDCRINRNEGEKGFCIYMPDLKFMDDAAALKYTRAKGYPGAVKEGIKEMHRQVGDLDEQGLAPAASCHGPIFMGPETQSRGCCMP